MIKNFFLIALRNLKKDFWYSLLNILGLTIGITFSLFLIFYVKDELSYDKHHEKVGTDFQDRLLYTGKGQDHRLDC